MKQAGEAAERLYTYREAMWEAAEYLEETAKTFDPPERFEVQAAAAMLRDRAAVFRTRVE